MGPYERRLRQQYMWRFRYLISKGRVPLENPEHIRKRGQLMDYFLRRGAELEAEAADNAQADLERIVAQAKPRKDRPPPP